MRIKTEHEVMEQARVMGEDFAKVRAREILKTFMQGSDLARELFDGYAAMYDGKGELSKLNASDHLEIALDDYEDAFGSVMALCYAVGQIDGVEKTRSDLYRKAKEPVQDGEKPSQLSLPGLK